MKVFKTTKLKQPLVILVLFISSSFISFSQINSANAPYNHLKKKLDGGYAMTYNNQLKFVLDEAYDIETGEYLTAILYDDSNTKIASCDAAGVTSGGMTALTYNFDDNRFTMQINAITGIVIDKFYTLEIINSKGDKKYLKFLYKN